MPSKSLSISFSPPPPHLNEDDIDNPREEVKKPDEPGGSIVTSSDLPSFSPSRIHSSSHSLSDPYPKQDDGTQTSKKKEKKGRNKKRNIPAKKKVMKKKTDRKSNNVSSWKEDRYMKTFVLPLEESCIMIKTENMKKRNLNKDARPIQCTRHMIGYVRSVKSIKSKSIIIEGVYLDQGVRQVREDELWFDRFGEKKNNNDNVWWVLSTPSEILLKNKITVQKIEELKKDVKDTSIPEQIIDTIEEPLAFSRFERIPIDENLACQICHNKDAKHPENGDMLVCDYCNDGCHENCDPDTIENQRHYMCPKCKKDE